MTPRTISLLVATVLFLALASPPRAQDGGAAPPRKLTKVELKRFRAIMAEATKAAKRGKHAAAMAAYDRALAIKPEDKAALTDQGWSAFQLKDYPRAEAITRRAIAAEGDERRTAAAEYNLGRILEARGDRDGAIAAYVSSLSGRPNRVVRAQLANLDPAAAAEMDPLKPVEMLGPFARLEDFCKTRREERERPGCPTPRPGVTAAKVGQPYGAVALIQAGDMCFLGFKLDRGWFVDRKGMGCQEDADWELTSVGLEVADLVPGGNPEVLLRTEVQENELWVNDEGFARSSSKGCTGWLVACGVRQKEVPRCIYMQTGQSWSSCGRGEATTWGWQLQPRFSPDGQMEVEATGTVDADAKALMGRRPLAFP